MTLKTYIFGLAVGTILAWVSWGLIVNSVAPESSGAIGYVFFFVSLFFGLFGTASLVGFVIRLRSGSAAPAFTFVAPAFRQAGIFSAVVTIALALQMFRVLTWWNIMLLLLAAGSFEMYFLSR